MIEEITVTLKNFPKLFSILNKKIKITKQNQLHVNMKKMAMYTYG